MLPHSQGGMNQQDRNDVISNNTFALRLVRANQERGGINTLKYPWGLEMRGPGPPGSGGPQFVALTTLTVGSNCKLQTRPIVREGAQHRQHRNCPTGVNICSWAPVRCLTPRHQPSSHSHCRWGRHQHRDRSPGT
jgi:hypothetical protein